MLLDSTRRSLFCGYIRVWKYSWCVHFTLSVLLLSSDPARSIADAVLIRVSSPVVTVSLTQSMACDLDECALSYSGSAPWLLSHRIYWPWLHL